jgi:hypothetical protein
MTSRDNFLRGVAGGSITDPEKEFFEGDKDLDEVDGAVFEEINDDDDAELLIGVEE